MIDVTQLPCSELHDGSTHHLQPRPEPGRRPSFTYRCAYCHRTATELRQEAEDHP